MSQFIELIRHDGNEVMVDQEHPSGVLNQLYQRARAERVLGQVTTEIGGKLRIDDDGLSVEWPLDTTLEALSDALQVIETCKHHSRSRKR